MSYYYHKVITGQAFDQALDLVKETLKKEGFGIITEINITDTFKNKLAVEFRNYRILGACSPRHAYAAISSEDKIGLFLPCNVIVQEVKDGVEVAAVDPVASMMAVVNAGLGEVALEIRHKLQRVIEAL